MLAIIIPYYKLTFFEETLQSLVNLTDERFKVYIGNDGIPEDPSYLFQKNKLLDEMIGIYLNNKKNVMLFIKVSVCFLSNILFRDYFSF